jgi:hypothetical protein
LSDAIREGEEDKGKVTWVATSVDVEGRKRD